MCDINNTSFRLRRKSPLDVKLCTLKEGYMSTSANQAANDIKTHESIRKIYSCCLVILLLLATVALVSYILGEESLPSLELVSSKSLAAVIYMAIIAIIACALFLNERAIRNSKKYSNLQKELDESERKNSELDNALLESERELEEAKALAERYWEMLPEDLRKLAEDQCKLEDAIEEMLELNSSQDTSSGS